MSATSAYNLRRRPGAADFAAAWDAALDYARDRAFTAALDRAVNGVVVPQFYRGRFTGMAHRHDYAGIVAALDRAK